MLQTVIETPTFIRRADKLLSSEEHSALIVWLAAYPTSADEMVGTGCVRKLRFGAKGKGKSGGVRVIYYFQDRDMPIYALLLYGKNERADLSPDERKSVAAFASAIKATRKRKNEQDRSGAVEVDGRGPCACGRQTKPRPRA